MPSLFPDAPLAAKPARARGQLDPSFLHRMECKACPLDRLKNINPHMPPSGSTKPLVYILGEAPGREEDKAGVQFVGDSGSILRPNIPRWIKNDVRFNNVVRTRPYENETPSVVAMECCRPSVTRDIESTKPLAIFGFGDVPFRWVQSDFSGITLWRGRRMPVKVGSHTCWYYPMLHPAFLLYEQRRGNKEAERMFRLDLVKAFEEVDKGLPQPMVRTPQEVFDDIECVSIGGPAGVGRIRDQLERLLKEPDVGIDYETDRLRPYNPDAMLLTASVASLDGGVSFPIDHQEAEWTEDERTEVFDLWVSFLERYQGRKWVHNLAFDLEWTGVYVARRLVRLGQWHDTASQACILDERRGKQKPGPFSLEFLSQLHFGFNLKKLTNMNRKKLADAPLENVLLYNGGDSRTHLWLGLKQHQLIEEQGLQEPYKLALRRVPTVVLTQIKGVPVDQDEVKVLKDKYEDRIEKIEVEIDSLPVVKKFSQLRGQPFNPGSQQDCLYLFVDMLKEPNCIIYDKHKKADRPSVDESVLESIGHPLAKLIVHHRKASRQNSTYISPLDALFNKTVVFHDGLLHAVFNTIFAETGRLSCEEPNLQNFPKRDGEAKEVRRPIKAPPGCLICAFDFGQIEARVIAMFTKDKAFCKALWENYDVHMEWAERIAWAYPQRIGGKKYLENGAFKVKGSEAAKALKDFRTDIKNQWTFPLFFGAKLESAAGYLSIPVEILRPLYDAFWEQFSGVKDWQDETLNFYQEYGYVECLTGRRRRGPLSLNQVINTPVQGTAAEIVMDSMCRLSEKGVWALQPEINIHDDLTFCRVPEKQVDDIAEQVITEMLDVPFPWVNVPISVEMSVGKNWMELEEVGTFSSDKWFK